MKTFLKKSIEKSPFFFFFFYKQNNFQYSSTTEECRVFFSITGLNLAITKFSLSTYTIKYFDVKLKISFNNGIKINKPLQK